MEATMRKMNINFSSALQKDNPFYVPVKSQKERLLFSDFFLFRYLHCSTENQLVVVLVALACALPSFSISP